MMGPRTRRAAGSCAALLACALTTLGAVPKSAAQTSVPPALSVEHRAIADGLEAHASVAALSTRYGERHPDMLAARARLRTHDARLRALLAAAAPAEILAWLRWQIADVDARLAELRVTCSTTHIDVRTAGERRAVFAGWLEALEQHRPLAPELERSLSGP